MVPDIGYDVHAQTTVCGNGLVHGAVEDHDERLKVGALASRSQPDPRLVALGSRLLEEIDSQVYPHTVEYLLDNGGNG